VSFKKQDEKFQDFSTSIIISLHIHITETERLVPEDGAIPDLEEEEAWKWGMEVQGIDINSNHNLDLTSFFNPTPKLLYSLIFFYFSYFHKWYIFIVLSQYFYPAFLHFFFFFSFHFAPKD